MCIWFVTLHDNPANVGVTAIASRLAIGSRVAGLHLFSRLSSSASPWEIIADKLSAAGRSWLAIRFSLTKRSECRLIVDAENSKTTGNAGVVLGTKGSSKGAFPLTKQTEKGKLEEGTEEN